MAWQCRKVYNKIIGNRCIIGEGPTCYELPVAWHLIRRFEAASPVAATELDM